MTTLPHPREAPVLLAPELIHRDEDGARYPSLVWRAGPGWRMASTALLGGGIGERAWVLNAQVRPGYDRMDPLAHLEALAASYGLTGPGVGLMTAAQAAEWTYGVDGGAEAAVTTGIGVPTWAASPASGSPGTPPPGTINIVATVPAAISDAALVNLVATATEAKVQALLDAGYACTGTASDAVCVAARIAAPGEPVEPFGGPRSVWGARLARAVYRAVLRGGLDDVRRRAVWNAATQGG